MSETQQSFSDKWKHNPDLAFRMTLQEGSDIQNWILTRNGFTTLSDLTAFLKTKSRILDAGCGNGRVTALIAKHAPQNAEIIGIDFSSVPAARINLEPFANVQVEERDLLADLGGLGRFDFIYCQEVLHHTADPARAFANLAKLLEPGGEFAIYVYKLKAPIREFADDLLREKLAGKNYEEAMIVARGVTELGRVLSAVEEDIVVPAIPELGIAAGRYSVQRFIYHFFLKCFWSDQLGAEENAVINYDWYRPQLATRHTIEEVRKWFYDSALDIVHEAIDEYGITVRGVLR